MKYINKKFFELPSQKEQMEWIEERTNVLLKRLPKLKKTLTVHNDVGNDIYNMTEQQIILASGSYIDAIKHNEITSKSSQKALVSYVANLDRLTNKTIKEIRIEYTNARMDSFIENAEKEISSEEYEYLHELLDQMTEEDKQSFVQSKFFLDNYSKGSDQWYEFQSTFGYSINIIKLELFMRERGYDTRDVYAEKQNYSKDREVHSTRKGVKK